MQSFTLFDGDAAIQVLIDDEGFATIGVDNIDNDEILVRAINRTFRAGAVRGTLFTGDVIHEPMARRHAMRAAKGVTYLGGKVTYLREGRLGPQFRIDWETMPFITE